jgi:predicted ATPase
LALLQELRADVLTFRANAQEAELLTREFNVRYYYDWATILVQFARAWQQPSSDILSHLQEAIRTFRETGARIRLPYYLSLLARAYHKADLPDDGVAVLDAAFAESREHNERWWDAELYRLRGELILSQGAGVKDVEAAFRQAIEIAQTQQAKSLELRAAMSLARLWHAHGRASAARDILIPLYAWFTEGFDTPDLQMAQALMTQLERD